MKKYIYVAFVLILLVFSCDVSKKAGATDAQYQLNLSHIECVGDKTEVHFVLLNVPDGITPGMVTYQYQFDLSLPNSAFNRQIGPSEHTGNVWHYRDYLGNGYIDVINAWVYVNGVKVVLHNPDDFSGYYNCTAPTPTPTSKETDEPPTPVNEPENTFTPTPTNVPTETDTPTSEPSPTVEIVTPTPTRSIDTPPTGLDPVEQPNPLTGNHIYFPFISRGCNVEVEVCGQ